MNAQRFGGAHSPGATPGAVVRAARSGGGFRGGSLFLLPSPLLLAGLTALMAGDGLRGLVDLAAYADLMLAAFLLREGQRAEAAYDARPVAQPPAFPRKLVAAVLAASGVGMATGFGWGQLAQGGTGIATTAVFAGLTLVCHILAFGLDPMRPKAVGAPGADSARIAAALDEAEARIDTIAALAKTLRDREIEERIAALLTQVRGMLGLIGADATDLDRARRYLKVYLTGAEAATRKYAAHAGQTTDAAIRAEYLSLLTTLEGSFESGRAVLLDNNRTDLEVEIEVLRDRLGQEGA